MDKFEIDLSPAASRDLDDLEMGMVTKVLSDLRILEDNPFPRGKLIKKDQRQKNFLLSFANGQVQGFF